MTSKAAINRAINRFERAADAMTFLGSVPAFGQDREEQEAIDEHRNAAVREYQRARAALVRMCEQ